MSKKKVKDYKTVSETKTIIECDVPSCFNTSKSKEMVEMAVNPRFSFRERKEPVVIEEGLGYSEAHSQVADLERKLTREKLEDGRWGVGYQYKNEFLQAKSDATFHVCSNCLKNHFGVEGIVPNNVDDIKKNDGNVVIEQTKEGLIVVNDVTLWLTAMMLITIMVLFRILFV